MSFNLTGAILKKIVPNLSEDKAKSLADLFCIICPKYGISNADIFHEFIANVAHESGGFTRYQENMNYSAKRLLEVFPKYFNVDSAARYANNKAAIGNRVYASRMGNGPEASGDGYRFRGGGGLQLTGKDMYRKYEAFKKSGLPIDILAEKIRTEDAWAMDSACWVFAIEKKLVPAAERDEFLMVVNRINGGTIGLADRKEYYERAKTYFPA